MGVHLVLVDFAAKLPAARGPARRRVLFRLPGVLAVAGSLVVADGVLFGPAGPSTPATVLWGAAAMLVAGPASVSGSSLRQLREGVQ